MEGALHHKGIIHIQNAVLNRVVVFVKNVSHSLAALIARADTCAARIAALADNLGNTAISVKAHGVLDSLSNKASADKSARPEFTHAQAFKQISVIVAERYIRADIGGIGVVYSNQIA